MSTHDPKDEIPGPVPQGARPPRSFTAVAAVFAAGVLLGGVAVSSVGQDVGRRILAPVSGMAASAAGFAADWQGSLLDGAIGAVVEGRADRMVRHLSIEIDATADQQDKLRAIVRDAIKDVLPVREKMRAARDTARELLTQQTIDRAAIEKFRTDQIAIHDAASKRLVAAIADAAEVLTPEQRREVSDMLPGRGGHWGPGWGRGPGRFLLWRN